MENNQEPFDILIDNMKISGTFYTEFSNEQIHKSLESNYHPDLVRKYGIDKVIPSEKGFIIKWFRRPWILTDSELTDRYGKCYLHYYSETLKSYEKARNKTSKQRGTTKSDRSQGD